MASNLSLAQTLLREAERCLQEARRYFAEGDWNLTIRRAQECVELALKGLLRAKGWEVPRRHDIGALVVEQMNLAGIGVEESERIIASSQRLAQQRAPAFYWEVVFQQPEAETALADAEFVLAWAREQLSLILNDAGG